MSLFSDLPLARYCVPVWDPWFLKLLIRRSHSSAQPAPGRGGRPPEGGPVEHAGPRAWAAAGEAAAGGGENGRQIDHGDDLPGGCPGL